MLPRTGPPTLGHEFRHSSARVIISCSLAATGNPPWGACEGEWTPPSCRRIENVRRYYFGATSRYRVSSSVRDTRVRDGLPQVSAVMSVSFSSWSLYVDGELHRHQDLFFAQHPPAMQVKELSRSFCESSGNISCQTKQFAEQWKCSAHGIEPRPSPKTIAANPDRVYYHPQRCLRSAACPRPGAPIGQSVRQTGSMVLVSTRFLPGNPRVGPDSQSSGGP
jgi:hypothetical protein